MTGTEIDIINCVSRLKTATTGQIGKELDLSPGYVDSLCRYLVRKGCLICSNRRYSLAKEGVVTLLEEEIPKDDRESIRDIISGLSESFSRELKKTVGDIRFPTYSGDGKGKNLEGEVKIKTNFDLHIEDESVGLESNINKIGAKRESEKSDIDKSVELLKRMSKGEKQ
jgi:hypothetical protein